MLYWLAKLIGLLPMSALHWLGERLAAFWLRGNRRESRVALRSLEVAFPQMPAAERHALHRAALQSTGWQMFETLRIWTRPVQQNLRLLHEGSGSELLDAAIASGRGVIMAAPHHGNWELLNQWLATRTTLAILYAPPESARVEAFLRRVRKAQGGENRVEQIRAEGIGIRQLFKRLQEGGVVGILPDQQPKQGDGIWAPFFGAPASTMTLIGRLAERTGAVVLFAWCERNADGQGFTLHMQAAPEAIAARDPLVSASALNAGIEALVRRNPAQYQWTYKRWSQQPEGSAFGNPYWPDCY
ncbi:lipid A biosynthesis lauroyl acyltransferase [Lysobacteraceae bacterium NML120232]|nr:lipid A biosynthesis lauroyl acyltransferase [Xanthomonadaceae bacterium NML08-0793]PJK11956.1 lipid A biosynthesis lauroyl acyltransferase [Xanthomonadaceae bacterium NML120232]